MCGSLTRYNYRRTEVEQQVYFRLGTTTTHITIQTTVCSIIAINFYKENNFGAQTVGNYYTLLNYRYNNKPIHVYNLLLSVAKLTDYRPFYLL